jgi:hypothetical protein
MLSLEEDVQAQALRQQGWSISAIARHLGVDRKTVRAYLSGEREPGRRRRMVATPPVAPPRLTVLARPKTCRLNSSEVMRVLSMIALIPTPPARRCAGTFSKIWDDSGTSLLPGSLRR